MAWPLLDELRAFVEREGWQDDLDGVVAREFRIADQTGVGRLDSDWLDGARIPLTLDIQFEWGRWNDSPAIKWPDPKRSCGAPFLISRDAAALLEGAIMARCLSWSIDDIDAGFLVEISFPSEFGMPARAYVRCTANIEPVARTLAALEAGHELGLWPTGNRIGRRSG